MAHNKNSKFPRFFNYCRAKQAINEVEHCVNVSCSTQSCCRVLGNFFQPSLIYMRNSMSFVLLINFIQPSVLVNNKYEE